MNGHELMQALDMLDTQRNHMIGAIKAYGGNDPRTRAQMAYYDGQKAMTELMAGDNVVIVVDDDHHRAIKTDGSGNALPDLIPTAEEARIIADYLEACPTSAVDVAGLTLTTTETREHFDSLAELCDALAVAVRVADAIKAADGETDSAGDTLTGLLFATRRDKNGHRKYLALDTVAGKICARSEWDMWASRSDFVEIGARDFDKLRDLIKKQGIECRHTIKLI